MSIPKEHHGAIIGSNGERLKKLEEKTATKITMPRIFESSTEIVITGSQEGLHQARHEIQLISDEQVTSK